MVIERVDLKLEYFGESFCASEDVGCFVVDWLTLQVLDVYLAVPLHHHFEEIFDQVDRLLFGLAQQFVFAREKCAQELADLRLVFGEVVFEQPGTQFAVLDFPRRYLETGGDVCGFDHLFETFCEVVRVWSASIRDYQIFLVQFLEIFDFFVTRFVYKIW